ncbi:MAG: hypothetical protein K2P14_04875 [Anaeroplasmataceae bacterium]|nr:hypothetical protein [Anaeroplasmataceae bacterium]HRF70333.1 hypothetical protein [Candidatus Pelethenecus sp.]
MKKIYMVEVSLQEDHIKIPGEVLNLIGVETGDQCKIFVVEDAVVIMGSSKFGEKILKN